ncbi:hypothetical protein [Flavobacterium algoritolerans]|uniref:ATP-binding protein n=1 Tax=Flavobacterium algoritolerans TaxID=3041254 RepID=A0ABT6V600_9FLAO|nr:hypothetical protein [Flavobacterium algoritolerans]MDI5893653.1 hypothetical protein [Flavobacterium algoritolerans]
MPKIEVNGKYDENNISQLIGKLNFIFDLKNKKVNDYNFSININTEDFTSIASLVIYKSLAYAIDEFCLLNPSVNKETFTDLFAKYHLQELMLAYLYEKDRDKIYANIKPVVKNDFFIAPHPISRVDFKNLDDIEAKYYKTIKDYYKNSNDGIVDCIKTCIVEISSNFHYHATDKKSILMAEGNANRIEIISVDTSEGIIGTMKKEYKNVTDKDLILNAFKRRVSSKINKGHCGTGLWLVNEMVTKLKGKLILHTGGYIYRNIQGKVTIFASSKWKGTVLYVKIPISNDMDNLIEDLFTNEKKYI